MTYLRLTKSERKEIVNSLAIACSIAEIANKLDRSYSTILREIKRNRTQTSKRNAYKKFADNNCALAPTCMKHHLCNDCIGPMNACRQCIRCNAVCDAYVPLFCERRDKNPGCCNGCKTRHTCHLVKYDYRWQEAHAYALKKQIESRRGLALTDEEILYLNTLISPLLKKGQSVHHIYMNHQEDITVSEKTLYTYIDAGLFDADVFDLPRKLGRKPSRKRPEKRTDKACHLNRTYEDFLRFREENPGIPVVQMDTLEGNKLSQKVLLTLKWEQTGFLMAFLLKRQTSAEVSRVFKGLQSALGQERFRGMFPIILTDRGSEFTDPKVIEKDQKDKWTYVFYCNPQRPQQKPHVENEHGLLRRKLPKGISFDHLTQEDISVIVSHTNSYKRESKGQKSPGELFQFTYGEDMLKFFGIEILHPDDVDLKPYKK